MGLQFIVVNNTAFSSQLQVKQVKPHEEVVSTFMLVRILYKALHMHPRAGQNGRRRAIFSLTSGWLCILSLRLTLCLGQIRNPKWFYKKVCNH